MAVVNFMAEADSFKATAKNELGGGYKAKGNPVYKITGLKPKYDAKTKSYTQYGTLNVSIQKAEMNMGTEKNPQVYEGYTVIIGGIWLFATKGKNVDIYVTRRDRSFKAYNESAKAYKERKYNFDYNNAKTYLLDNYKTMEDLDTLYKLGQTLKVRDLEAEKDIKALA